MNASSITPPRWYRIVAVIAVLWMLFGVLAWFMDFMTDEATVAGLSDAQRQVYAQRPQWLFVAYGIAIFTGLAGAVGLLMRKSWATPALAISLIAVVVQFGYTFLGMDTIALLGAAVALPFPIVIFLIGALLLWLSMHAKQRGWITS